MRWWLLALVGCGRIGFDPPGLAGDDVANGDARTTGDGLIAGGGPQLVDSGTEDIPSGNSLTENLPNGVQTGDVIIACIGFRDGTTDITSVTDTLGNTYMREVATHRANSAISQECVVAISSTTASSFQVTTSLSVAANQPSLRVLVYRGVDTTNTIQAQSSAASNTQIMSATAVVLQTGTKVVGINTADRAATPAAALTLLFTNAYGDIVGERTATTTGALMTPASLASPGTWVMEAIALPPL